MREKRHEGSGGGLVRRVRRLEVYFAIAAVVLLILSVSCILQGVIVSRIVDWMQMVTDAVAGQTRQAGRGTEAFRAVAAAVGK